MAPIAAAIPQSRPASALVVGVISTGAMATAQAKLFASQGFNVIIGSRDPGKAKASAAQIGPRARGGSHIEAIRESDVIFVTIMPGQVVRSFLEANRAALAGKMLVDPSASYYYESEFHPLPPHESSTTWNKEILGDAGVSWAATFKSMGTDSVSRNNKQPIEVCGDEPAKTAVMQMLEICGWEPLDCGSVDDTPFIEPRGPKRRKHPRIVEYDATHAMDKNAIIDPP